MSMNETDAAIKEAYAAGWRDAVSLAAIRIRAYESDGADDAIRELELMAEEATNAP